MMFNMNGMNLKALRLRLAQLALDIEKLDADKAGFLSLPFHITTELTNLERDVTSEIKRLKEKEHKDYISSPR